MIQYFFTKLSGAGNDFVLFDTDINGEIDLNPLKIKEICDRHYGIGADGLILFSRKSGSNFEMKYFNADGSAGSLCANGARCSLYYASEIGLINKEEVTFQSNGINYSGRVLEGGLVKFNFNKPTEYKLNFKIKAVKQLITASYINTGSPHVVINVNDILVDSSKPNQFFRDIDELSVYEIGKEIRYSRDFAPLGTNVNFYELGRDQIKIRSYERGVENETLACGTGIVGTALILYQTKKMNPPFNFLSRGGDNLKVTFDINEHEISNLSLIGPAEIVFKGEITI